MDPHTITLTPREAIAVGERCRVSPTIIDGAQAVAVLVAYAPGPLDSDEAPLLPLPGTLGARVLHLSAPMPPEIYLRRFARRWLLTSSGDPDPIDRAARAAADLLRAWQGRPIVLIGPFVRAAFALALAHEGFPAWAMSLRHLPDRSMLVDTSPAIYGIPATAQITRIDLRWIETTNEVQLRNRAQNDVRALLRGAAMIDTPPCPICRTTIGEIEPTTAMVCMECRSYLRRTIDVVTGLPGDWAVIR